ncbi:hypothetical protein KOM01_000110 [Dyadobacter fermentans]|nr:hypothetical protein [Dyadobacter fermentans]
MKKILFLEFDAVFYEHFQIFFGKGNSIMMLFLILNVFVKPLH